MFLAVYSRRWATPPPKRSGNRLLTDASDASIEQSRVMTETNLTIDHGTSKTTASSVPRKHRLVSRSPICMDYGTQKPAEPTKMRARGLKNSDSMFNSQLTPPQLDQFSQKTTLPARFARNTDNNVRKVNISPLFPSQAQVKRFIPQINDQTSYLFAVHYMNSKKSKLPERPAMRSRNESFIITRKKEVGEQSFTKEAMSFVEPRGENENTLESEKSVVVGERRIKKSILRTVEPPENDFQQDDPNSSGRESKKRRASAMRRVSFLEGHVLP